MKKLIFATIAIASCLSLSAIPPLPGYIDVSQPDGSVFKARIEGNSQFSYYVTPEGEYLVADSSDGFFKPAGVNASGQLVPLVAGITPACRLSADKVREAAAVTRSDRAGILESRRDKGMRKVAPGAIKQDFPTTGTVRGLIVLAEFSDVKFLPGSTREYFDTKINQYGYSGVETDGSVVDYFKEQSGGLFTPEFDVVGPVTLPRDRYYYGYGTVGEENLDALFRDAASAANTQAGVDFTQYDINNDYFVDFFFVIFPGHSQSQGGPAECVWPSMKDVSDFVFDAFDGMYLGVCACSCELKHGDGTDLDGIGTICHEFSHIIGLPDVYDPTGSGGYGMGHYDMMCYGPYNNDLITPSGYTAMDKYTLGWLEPRVLDGAEEGVTLRSFMSTNDCCFIVNPDNANEYYTIENRQPEGFDSGLPGHGLVISYVHYDKPLWARNTVNSPGMSRYEHISIVPADGYKELYINNNIAVEAGDTWPGTHNVSEFSSTTNPAAVWRSSGKVVPADISITNIRESADGTVTFDYNVQASANEITFDADETRTYYNLQGIEVPANTLDKGVYIVRTASGKTAKVAVE